MAPAELDIWTAQASGQGTKVVTCRPSDCTVVTMNSDGSAAVHVTADVGATVPLFEAAMCWFLVVGLFVGTLGAGLIAFAMVRSRPRARSARG